MATLIENPAIEATRIVWESELEGTAKELLNAAEGDQTGKVPKLGTAKQFLADILASARLPATEIETLARAANVSWASVRRASDEMGIRKFREGNKSWWQLT
jgi:putative DNA primase/helicase